jgi:hypothetical protein
MDTQHEKDRKDVKKEVKPGDLEASDFFPPGVGWNRKDGERVGGEEEEEELRRRERERTAERH